jgi:tripeptide aminopeptidase
MKYAVLDTQSHDGASTVPSTEKQFDLAKLLVKELSELGLERVEMTDNAYVYAFLPASEGMENEPTMGLIAHLDTATDFPVPMCVPLSMRDITAGI